MRCLRALHIYIYLKQSNHTFVLDTHIHIFKQQQQQLPEKKEKYWSLFKYRFR